MKQTIKISPVTRIEGHAKITLEMGESGQIEKAQFHVNEFRGFEKFCEGRMYTEMPTITPRICGICPVSHAIASVKACEMIQGIEPAITGNKLRRLMHLGQNISSHALSFFHLSSPDFLLGYDADPNHRNIIGVAARFPEIAKRGIRLRQFGQEISERITGKKIHAMGIAPGGLSYPITESNRLALLDWVEEAKETVQIGLEIIKRFHQENDWVNEFASFPSLYLGTVAPNGAHELYDGKLRFVDNEGTILEDQWDPANYLEMIAERSVDFSYLTWPYYKPYGIDNGTYRVGPLARLNVASSMKTPLAQKEFDLFKSINKGQPVQGSFFFHYARLIETLSSVEEAGNILSDRTLTNTEVQKIGKWNTEIGVGCTEAPRGTLFHQYNTDRSGKLQKVNLLIATGQNNPAMNRSILEVARQFIKGTEIKEEMLNKVESAIRCYDPCLSCSTHAMGQMPLVIELIGQDGKQLKELIRN